MRLVCFSIRWYYLIPLGLLLLPALLLRLADQPYAVREESGRLVRDRGDYSGAQACRPCHAGIVERQLASRHAQTVRELSHAAPLAPFQTDQVVIDRASNIRYAPEKTPRGAPQLTAMVGEMRASRELLYEFGSGSHAYGYLGRREPGDWFDARLNYYTSIQRWDLTTGQTNPGPALSAHFFGRQQNEMEALRCFICHSTTVQVQGKGEVADGKRVRLRPDRSVLGVTCEACHGPRGDHVRERRAGASVSAPALLSAAEINQMCGRCHGLTGGNPEHPATARVQPYALALSRCYQGSHGRLSCLTCHDPHEDAPRGPAMYDAKCVSCHLRSAEGGATVCPVAKREGCVRCHMPQESRAMLHTTFYDHRIRVVPSSGAPPGAGRSPGSSQRSPT